MVLQCITGVLNYRCIFSYIICMRMTLGKKSEVIFSIYIDIAEIYELNFFIDVCNLLVIFASIYG
jgi:hypothetical protein